MDSVTTDTVAFKIRLRQIYSESSEKTIALVDKFKIQYGQIYSSEILAICDTEEHLKSNMDRFIA